MEDMRARFSPYFSQVQDNAQAKITTLNELLQSQMDSVTTSVWDTVQSLKDGFTRNTEDLMSTLEDKGEELRGWFHSYVSMFTL